MERILMQCRITDTCKEAIDLAKQTTIVLRIGMNSELDLKQEVINNYLNLQYKNLNLLADYQEIYLANYSKPVKQ